MGTEQYNKNGCPERARWRALAQAGQSVIEVALVSPLLILMFAGLVDLGRWIYLGIEVSSAARAGVQYGAQSRVTATDNAGITKAAQNDTPDIGSLAVTPSQSCQCSTAPGTNVGCVLSSCPGSQLILSLKVNTSAQYKPWLPYPGIASSINVNGKAVSSVGQ